MMEKCSEAYLNTLLTKLESENEIYKLCFECLKNPDSYVLIFAKEPPPLVGLVEDVSKSELQRLVIMQHDCIDNMARKLLLLYDWTIVPALVVLDLRSYINELHNMSTAKATIRKSVCFAIAVLVNYMNCVNLRLQSGTNPKLPLSITVLPHQDNVINVSDIELLKNLYFYKHNVFENTEDVCNIALDRINPTSHRVATTNCDT